MATSKLTVRHTDANGNKATEIFICDPAIINVNIDSDTATAIDSWARGFVNLTTETYQNCDISQVQSVNEILSE